MFSGNVVVGIVGIFTGISKQGGFSISINERSLGGSIEKNAMEGLLKHSQLPSFLAREVCMILTCLVPILYILCLTDFNACCSC